MLNVTRRRALVIVLLAAVVFFASPAYWVVSGWWQGDAFYRGRPTRYWAGAIRAWSPEHTLRLRDRTRWLLRLLPSLRLGYPPDVFILGETSAVPVLRELTRWDDVWVRSRAVSALQSYGHMSEEIVPTLVQALEDDSTQVRGLAVSALVQVGDKDRRVRAALAARVQHESHATVRELAEQAVQRLVAQTAAAAGIR